MTRLTLAYSLMALMALGIGALVAWRIYHSRTRTYRRRQVKEIASHQSELERKAGLPEAR